LNQHNGDDSPQKCFKEAYSVYTPIVRAVSSGGPLQSRVVKSGSCVLKILFIAKAFSVMILKKVNLNAIHQLPVRGYVDFGLAPRCN
jgi:hypothetical protein